MESLLALKGIKLVTSFNTKGDQYKYYYTEKMLSNDMFIEFYKHPYEPGEDETMDGIKKTETGVGVIMYYDKVAYHFMVLNEIKPQVYTTSQAEADMRIFRIILNLVDLIQTAVTGTLVELLHGASVDTFTSLEFDDEPDLQAGFHDMVVKKIRTIQEGIEAIRSRNN